MQNLASVAVSQQHRTHSSQGPIEELARVSLCRAAKVQSRNWLGRSHQELSGPGPASPQVTNGDPAHAPQLQPLQLTTTVTGGDQSPNASEDKEASYSRVYRTCEENKLEIARLTLDPSPAAQPQDAAVRCEVRDAAVRCEVRRDWLGREERWFTADEVASHNTPKDLWLTAHGKVYDVTVWVERHPGGAAALLRRGGQDASRDLDFHSKRARELWEATCIGKLDEGGRVGGLAGWLFFD